MYLTSKNNILWGGAITVIGYGTHGKKHVLKHLKQGCRFLNIIDNSENILQNIENKNLNISNKLEEIKITPWLVDFCSWNETHIGYIIDSIKLGANAILVEKPAVMSIEEYIIAINMSEEYSVPIFVSENYIFSPSINFARNWIEDKIGNNFKINIELSKDRSTDFKNKRGGNKLRFVDIEIPHAIATLRKILDVFNINILDYNSLDIIKENELSINIYIVYHKIEVLLKCDLLALERKRILQINTNNHYLNISLPIGGANNLNDFEYVKTSSGINKKFMSDPLDLLISSIKLYFLDSNKSNKKHKLFLNEFLDDLKLMKIINEKILCV